MAIEKMKLLNLVGALDEENAILQELVLCENVHLNLEHSDAYDNSYIMHEYEAMMPSGTATRKEENYSEIQSKLGEVMNQVDKMSSDLRLKIKVAKDGIKAYTRQQAIKDFEELQGKIGSDLEAIGQKKSKVSELKLLDQRLGYITKDIDFSTLDKLNYFEYEIGMLSRDNRVHIRKNYENISALIFEVGEIEDSREDIYIVFYLSEFKDETQKILKSLNWSKLDIQVNLVGNVESTRKDLASKISVLEKQIERLEKDVFENKEETNLLLDRIYSRLQLELKIYALKEQIFRGNNVFVLSAWIKARDYDVLEEHIASVTDKYVMLSKDPKELGDSVMPPTELKNNWFFKPFEMIVKLYGLPTYNEIDPTPFLAITFCLMFGIMFGDVGQGAVYFLAGVFLAKKMPTPAGILKRLGATSVIFGFVYGSIFGLEEIPVIKDIALVHGGPLNTTNIMPILVAGVAFGVAVLTVSFVIGIINCLRRRDIEGALFGKNGVAGYLFFMGFICTALCIVKAIPVSVVVPVVVMVLMMAIMVLKEPLAHLVEGEKELIKGETSAYFVESGFEGFETLLSTLSNSISFIRVGAFALNHAGLFLAFSVMASLVPYIWLKILIIILGNILILTLEGLVVFIQGLRLQYYEMFSKYFGGDGIPYTPLKIEER
nr:V-type ATPase 116kDa subunit family protein [uncultured Cellulosilyticum sp.]